MLPLQGAQVQSPVGELRSHGPCKESGRSSHRGRVLGGQVSHNSPRLPSVKGPQNVRRQDRKSIELPILAVLIRGMTWFRFYGFEA